MRKLSKKRKKNGKSKKEGMKKPDYPDDDIPDDWQPDFIPKNENSSSYATQPDVVTACSSEESLNDTDKSDEEAVNAIIRYRSNKRLVI